MKMLIILVGFHLVIYLDILNLVVGTVRPHAPRSGSSKHHQVQCGAAAGTNIASCYHGSGNAMLVTKCVLRTEDQRMGCDSE